MGEPKDIGVCERCKKQFEYRIIHNGFNDSVYAYCEKCGRTSILSVYSEKVPKLDGLKFYQQVVKELEPYLERCQCGGVFRGDASPRCPHCKAELSPVEATNWIEANAPGTKGGWRWQRSWQGLYCIIVEGCVVNDNWKPLPTN